MIAAKQTFKTVDEYIKTFPKDVQKILETVRQVIKKSAPKAQEAISYQIPTFKLNGNLVHFAAFKNHISIYPAPRSVQEFKKELSGFKGGKGTVQFPLDKPVPLPLVRKIVGYRIKINSTKKSNKKK